MAGHRPRDWHVLDLDKDPTPGDPDRVRSLANQLHDFADDVGEALRLVKGMAEDDAVLQWAGKSAKVFQDEFSGVPKNLRKLKKSYEMCGDALAGFWPKLERAQALADKALAKAREAQHDLSSAKSRLSSADSWVTRATKEADKYKDDPTGSKSDGDKPDEAKVRAATRDAQNAKTAHDKAQSDVTSAQNALDAAKKMAEDARKMREEAAREAKQKIDDASDAGIQNRSWWEDVGDWFEDNWDTIVAVCKVVVAVVGIIAMIIGGPILGAILLVAALVVLADTLYRYSKGQASLWDVAFAALDCIPGGKGLTSLGKLAKGMKGLKAMRLKGMANALRGLAKNGRTAIADGAKGAYNRAKSLVRSKGSDPIDMASGAMYLPQADVTLPGNLPFTFVRRVASDYRSGWWFGPSWASTIDQRLEVDALGVVFVTEDGLLLAYPHPDSPETPVLPESGPCWPLHRLENGGYRVVDPLTGHGRVFTAPREGICLLDRITDRNHNYLHFEYDAEGTPQAVQHSGGYRLRLTVDEGRITALVLDGAAEDGSDVTVKEYGYTDGNLTSVTNSSGRPLRFTYDERLRVTSWEDTNQRRYHYAYDDRDRCIAEGGEAGHLAISLTYDGVDPAWPDCRITTLTTAEGAVSRFVVDERLLVVGEMDAVGGVVTTTYDSDQHVVATTDQLGHRTTFVNNEAGMPTETVRPDGSVIRVLYDDRSLPQTIVLPDGSSWQYSYDERGNVVAITDPVDATTYFGRSADGSVVEVWDASGRTLSCVNNAAGLPLAVTDSLGKTTRYAYNGFGLITTVTDPLGSETHLEWTVEGLLASRTAPDGTEETWEYDGEGNCVRHVDAVGEVTTLEYTHFDRLSARIGPRGERYTFEHDPQLRLAQVTNPQGLTWNYSYDTAGRLLAESDFDGRTTRYDYDAAGRLVCRTNALGQRVHYQRDALGQITAKDADGTTTVYTYAANGSLTEAVAPHSSLYVELDAVGRRIRETVDGRTMCFGYDASGNRTLRTTPSGARSTWAYDAAGRSVRLETGGHTIDFTHDAADREVTRCVDGALTVTSAYDMLNRLVAVEGKAPGGRQVAKRAYSYRPDGYLASVQEAGKRRRRLELDANGRVTAVHAEGWNERYAYDAAGNQTEAVWPGQHPGHEAAGSRDYVGTRLERAGGVHYEYDRLGRVVLRRKSRLSRKPDIWRYEWDAEDRLTSVITPDGTRWRYTYDPLGRRTAKLRLGADGHSVIERTIFTWDGNTLCEQTTEQGDAGVRTTLTWNHDGLAPLSQAERIWTVEAPQETIDERFFAIVTDLVGTPTELISPDGEVAWHTRSTLWGITAWSRDATAYTPLRFPGQYHDPETGLHYNHHRHYDPETGRYTSPDPLGLLPAPNPVAYVHNPHTWSDPLGLAPLCHLHGGETGSPGGPGILPGPAPQHAVDMLNKVNARPGGIGKIDGYHGNSNWGNNLNQLPGGKYKEWDVNAKVDLPRCSAPGCGKEIRGTERLLTPKDGPGPAYYTPDHYGTFYYVGEFTG